MPGGDKTGPMGEGPMTGRRAGICAGASEFRRGGGRRMRRNWMPASRGVTADQVQVLKERVESIQKQLDALEAS
jgi:hypothetical protein